MAIAPSYCSTSRPDKPLLQGLLKRARVKNCLCVRVVDAPIRRLPPRAEDILKLDSRPVIREGSGSALSPSEAVELGLKPPIRPFVVVQGEFFNRQLTRPRRPQAVFVAPTLQIGTASHVCKFGLLFLGEFAFRSQIVRQLHGFPRPCSLSKSKHLSTHGLGGHAVFVSKELVKTRFFHKPVSILETIAVGAPIFPDDQLRRCDDPVRRGRGGPHVARAIRPAHPAPIRRIANPRHGDGVFGRVEWQEKRRRASTIAGIVGLFAGGTDNNVDDIIAIMTSFTANLFMAGHGRDRDREADLFASFYLNETDVGDRPLLNSFRKLKFARDAHDPFGDGGGGLFATHPHIEERLDRAGVTTTASFLEENVCQGVTDNGELVATLRFDVQRLFQNELDVIVTLSTTPELSEEDDVNTINVRVAGQRIPLRERTAEKIFPSDEVSAVAAS